MKGGVRVRERERESEQRGEQGRLAKEGRQVSRGQREQEAGFIFWCGAQSVEEQDGGDMKRGGRGKGEVTEGENEAREGKRDTERVAGMWA